MTVATAWARRAAATILIACLASGQPALAAKAKKAAAPPPPPLPAIHPPYIVVDAGNGEVIEEVDALRPWYPASTTKLMTIYVAFRAIQQGQIALTSPVLYSERAAEEPPSKMGFRPGTILSLDDALKIMMVKSANDIAVVVAEAVGGTIQGFAARMNAEAKRLGMSRSHFSNPNGLPDPNTYSTARDMAILARALLNDFPQYRFYFELPAIQIGGRVLRNFNTLIDRYPGATGMKTGFICASGYNLVGSARRGERELIAVVFGAPGGRARAEQAAALLDAAFTTSRAARDDDYPTLQTINSGASYAAPFDMRAYVCGPRPVTIASEENDDGAADDQALSHLTENRIDRGPPVKVTARIPAIFGEAGFIAPLPRPRPSAVANTPPAELNAFAPLEGGETSAPAEAIGAAAGSPQPLNGVAPQ